MKVAWQPIQSWRNRMVSVDWKIQLYLQRGDNLIFVADKKKTEICDTLIANTSSVNVHVITLVDIMLAKEIFLQVFSATPWIIACEMERTDWLVVLSVRRQCAVPSWSACLRQIRATQLQQETVEPTVVLTVVRYLDSYAAPRTCNSKLLCVFRIIWNICLILHEVMENDTVGESFLNWEFFLPCQGFKVL